MIEFNNRKKRRSFFASLFSSNAQSPAPEISGAAAQERAEAISDDDDDASYRRELDRRLEKWRQISGGKLAPGNCSSNSATTTTTSSEKGPFLDGKSPDEWRTNEHYIPTTGASPALEHFLSVHQIRMSDNELTSSSSSSSISSGGERGARAPAEPLPVDKQSVIERDGGGAERRLINWRLLARVWRSESESSRQSSIASSDDNDLDHADTGRALVVTCSDDTSCSSVELIWRPDAERQVRAESGSVSRPRPLSVLELELAKPRRARTRRFGLKWGRRHQSSASAVEQQRQRQNDQQWVANPLFTDDAHDLLRDPSTNFGDRKLFEANNFEDEDEAGEDCGEDVRRKKRWSSFSHRLRRSESSCSSGSGSGRGSGKDLTKQLANLDRRIKSNVSSLKSLLTDTGKRASLLADQLMSSIKDSAREQLFPNRDLNSANPAEEGRGGDSWQNGSGGEPASENSKRQARLFSLIYQHQQQANGQPVITRQPLPSARLPEAARSPAPASIAAGSSEDAISCDSGSPSERHTSRRKSGRERRHFNVAAESSSSEDEDNNHEQQPSLLATATTTTTTTTTATTTETKTNRRQKSKQT